MVVDELVRGGVREAVLCPGSRNAPLSFALHDADTRRPAAAARADRRADGRLPRPRPGQGVRSRRCRSSRPRAPRPSTCTPPSSRPTTRASRSWCSPPTGRRRCAAPAPTRPSTRSGSTAGRCALLRPLVDDGRDRSPAGARLSTGHSARRGRPGPPQRRLPRAAGPGRGPTWSDPPVAEPELARVVTGGRQAWGYLPLAAGGRTVVVAGDQALADARGLAEAGGWPLLAEPSSGARGGPNAVGTYRLLLEHLGGDIERVVVAGRPTLSRPVTGLLARDDIELFRLRDDARTPQVTGAATVPGWPVVRRPTDRLARRSRRARRRAAHRPRVARRGRRVPSPPPGCSSPVRPARSATSTSPTRGTRRRSSWPTAVPPASTARCPPPWAPRSPTAHRRTH